ncbi:MAG: hypothetical protein WDW36_003893 [Sanguina aurantia]
MLAFSGTRPVLLQLLLDASPEIRSASAALIGTIGAGLASRQPADQQRAPHAGRPPPARQQQQQQQQPALALAPAALFEWALPALSSGQVIGRRQRLLMEEQEAILQALSACVQQLQPASVLAGHAPAVLDCCKALLESTATSAQLLQPLLPVMSAALAHCSHAALVGALPDVVDLLLGWALEAELAAEDRCSMEEVSAEPLQQRVGMLMHLRGDGVTPEQLGLCQVGSLLAALVAVGVTAQLYRSERLAISA